jgi:flavin reductase (DIM6/NTAB) family NADH-FMN oxidoreductase RutF
MSAEPPIVVFGPSCTDNPEQLYKDTYVNLVDTQECVIQMVTYDMREAMLKCSASVAFEIDEFKVSGLTPIASDIVKAPRVKESPFQMECKLLEMKNFGKFPGGGNMAICEVVKFHIDEKIFKSGTNRIDPLITDFIARNGAAYYTRANADAMFEMK